MMAGPLRLIFLGPTKKSPKMDTKTIVTTAVVAAAAVGVGYVLGARAESKKHWNTEPKICDTILDHVGNTPLVRINRIGKAEGVEVKRSHCFMVNGKPVLIECLSFFFLCVLFPLPYSVKSYASVNSSMPVVRSKIALANAWSWTLRQEAILKKVTF
jgi:hypothetical protein